MSDSQGPEIDFLQLVAEELRDAGLQGEEIEVALSLISQAIADGFRGRSGAWLRDRLGQWQVGSSSGIGIYPAPHPLGMKECPATALAFVFRSDSLARSVEDLCRLAEVCYPILRTVVVVSATLNGVGNDALRELSLMIDHVLLVYDTPGGPQVLSIG